MLLLNELGRQVKNVKIKVIQLLKPKKTMPVTPEIDVEELHICSTQHFAPLNFAMTYYDTSDVTQDHMTNGVVILSGRAFRHAHERNTQYTCLYMAIGGTDWLTGSLTDLRMRAHFPGSARAINGISFKKNRRAASLHIMELLRSAVRQGHSLERNLSVYLKRAISPTLWGKQLPGKLKVLKDWRLRSACILFLVLWYGKIYSLPSKLIPRIGV